MPASLEILTDIITGATEIADRFRLCGRRVHLREQARAQELGQFARIAAIGFDPLSGFSWNERRRNDLAAHPRRRQLALQGVSTCTGLVTDMDGPWRTLLERAHQSTGSR